MRRTLRLVGVLEWRSRLRGVKNIIVEVTKASFLPQLSFFFVFSF